VIRRDYILRMIEEFCQALARMRSLKQGQRWAEAEKELESEFQKLIGEGAEAVSRLSETELLASLMKEGPTHLLRDKTFIISSLLKEAGDIAAGKEQIEESQRCYLKALHLVLDVLGRDDASECPEFVPKVELLRELLQDTELPVRTLGMLMQYYERNGEFGKAEDMLFAMLEAEFGHSNIVDFGVAFYKRLLAQSDKALADGNLPRSEVEYGLKEFETWQAERRSGTTRSQSAS